MSLKNEIEIRGLSQMKVQCVCPLLFSSRKFRSNKNKAASLHGEASGHVDTQRGNKYHHRWVSGEKEERLSLLRCVYSSFATRVQWLWPVMGQLCSRVWVNSFHTYLLNACVPGAVLCCAEQTPALLCWRLSTLQGLTSAYFSFHPLGALWTASQVKWLAVPWV